MSKSVWITMVKKDEAAARAVYKMISGYGLGVNGHFWKDDPENMEWAGAISQIAAGQTGLWLIVGDSQDFTPSIIRGLSLLSLAVRAQKAGQVPVIIIAGDPDAVSEKLPAPLADSLIYSPDNPTLGAKITAKANMPVKKSGAEYRFNVYAIPKIGLWLEAGPASGSWEGVIFGAEQAGVDAMGIGPAGSIPERSTLEYPLRDMKLALGDREFTAWAAGNSVSDSESVYVRVKGQPRAFIFGPFDSNAETLNVYTLPLE